MILGLSSLLVFLLNRLDLLGCLLAVVFVGCEIGRHLEQLGARVHYDSLFLGCLELYQGVVVAKLVDEDVILGYQERLLRGDSRLWFVILHVVFLQGYCSEYLLIDNVWV